MSLPNAKLSILRNSAALSLVGGNLTQDYPYHRFKDGKGRLFSIVGQDEKKGAEAALHFAGFKKLDFTVASPKDPSLKFEVYVVQDQLTLWKKEIAAHKMPKKVPVNAGEEADEQDEGTRVKT